MQFSQTSFWSPPSQKVRYDGAGIIFFLVGEAASHRRRIKMVR
ncbi:unnamed protein product [Chondrus crispus]|uniref:Uncharacterized protein n=1 Tax=Chondrus crispus TaxID=2769 RepID=R7QAB9_CHOCR|nr:unnamed protein product [Chondrus crispus]CDF34738.1 unnamed protein product [Chondrus crispus]|eukprot:XP_005714557.1 unnamed protein product [Chondrus crispus]